MRLSCETEKENKMKTYNTKQTVHEIELTEAQVAMVVSVLASDIQTSAWNESDYSDPEYMGFLKERADVFQMLKGLPQ